MNDEQYRTLLKGMEELHEVAQNTLTSVDALSLDIQDLSERLAGRQNDCPTPPPWVGSTAITGLSDDLEDDQDDNLHLMAGHGVGDPIGWVNLLSLATAALIAILLLWVTS